MSIGCVNAWSEGTGKSSSKRWFVRAIMDDRRNSREVVTILFLCLLWYGISSSSNVVGKMLLSEFPFPMTVTMVQLTSITVYSGPFFNLWGVRKYSSDIPWGYYLRLIVPLAFGKFLANVFSHVSIWKVPVSYAHTGMKYYFDSHVCYTWPFLKIKQAALYFRTRAPSLFGATILPSRQ